VRAVVDTNVWVSAVLSSAGPPAAVRAALERRRFTLVTSEPLLAEIAEVLARPRFGERYGVTAADASELVALLREQAELVQVTGAMQLCRDPDDDIVIETARNGRADALVTRDDDLKSDWGSCAAPRCPGSPGAECAPLSGGTRCRNGNHSIDRPGEAGVKIRAPVCALWGSRGPSASSTVLDRWREAADDVRGAAIPDAAHYVQEEQPRLVAEHILRFADEIGITPHPNPPPQGGRGQAR